MNKLNSLTVILDDRSGSIGWYVRAELNGDGDAVQRDIPLDCEPDSDDEELIDEARFEARMDALLLVDVPDDFPVTVAR